MKALLEKIQTQAISGKIRYTLHASQEMFEDDFSSEDVFQAISTGEILENYPAHQRGACCLLSGITDRGKHLHLVCTTQQSLIIVITVYEPLPPKWITPTQRRNR